MSSSYISDLLDRLEMVTKRSRGSFGFMTAEQLNWSPTEKQWSIAQNLDHLILFNKSFFPLLVQVADGIKPSRKREKVPILPEFWASYYRQVLNGSSIRKRKTPSAFQPSHKPYDIELIDQFVDHQGALHQLVARIPEDALRATVTLPSKAIATMKLEDCLKMLIQHEEHHLQQALSVKGFRTFPTGKTANIASPRRGPQLAHPKTA